MKSDAEKPEGHSIEGGIIQRLSVSALKTARRCRRRYWYKYKLRLPDSPPGKGALLGTEGHKRIEFHLKGGGNVLGPMEQAGAQYIPAPGPGLLVEEHFGKPTPLTVAGIPMTGFIDLVDWAAPTTVRVTDWKFYGDVRGRFVAAKSDLLDPTTEHGIQMTGYGAWVNAAKARFPGVETVILRMVYFQTKGRRDAVEVSTDAVPLTTVADSWLTINPLVEEIKADAKQDDQERVPTNDYACMDFGKQCPYFKRCQSPEARLNKIFATGFVKLAKGEQMGMMGKMLDATPAPVMPAAAAPPSRIVIVDETAVRADFIPAQGGFYTVGADRRVARFLSMTSGKYSFLPLDGKSGPILVDATALSSVVTLATEAQIQAVPALVLPPDAPKSDPALASKPLPATSAPQPVAAATHVQGASPTPPAGNSSTPEIGSPVTDQRPVAPQKAEGNSPQVQEAPGAAESAPGPNAKRKRRTKAEMEAARAAQPLPAVDSRPQTSELATATGVAQVAAGNSAPPAAEAAAEVTAVPGPLPGAAVAGLRLFINCTPTGIQATPLQVYVEAICSQLIEKAQLNILDIRLANGELLGFGKWRGALAAIARDRPPKGDWVAYTYGDERVAAVLEALIPLCAPGYPVIGGGR